MDNIDEKELLNVGELTITAIIANLLNETDEELFEMLDKALTAYTNMFEINEQIKPMVEMLIKLAPTHSKVSEIKETEIVKQKMLDCLTDLINAIKAEQRRRAIR